MSRKSNSKVGSSRDIYKSAPKRQVLQKRDTAPPSEGYQDIDTVTRQADANMRKSIAGRLELKVRKASSRNVVEPVDAGAVVAKGGEVLDPKAGATGNLETPDAPGKKKGKLDPGSPGVGGIMAWMRRRKAKTGKKKEEVDKQVVDWRAVYLRLDVPPENWWIVSPSSPYKRWWDIVMVLLVIYIAIMVPWNLAFDRNEPWEFDALLYVLFTMDIVLSCVTGYERGGVEILNHKAIILVRWGRTCVWWCELFSNSLWNEHGKWVGCGIFPRLARAHAFWPNTYAGTRVEFIPSLRPRVRTITRSCRYMYTYRSHTLYFLTHLSPHSVFYAKHTHTHHHHIASISHTSTLHTELHSFLVCHRLPCHFSVRALGGNRRRVEQNGQVGARVPGGQEHPRPPCLAHFPSSSPGSHFQGLQVRFALCSYTSPSQPPPNPDPTRSNHNTKSHRPQNPTCLCARRGAWLCWSQTRSSGVALPRTRLPMIGS